MKTTERIAAGRGIQNLLRQKGIGVVKVNKMLRDGLLIDEFDETLDEPAMTCEAEEDYFVVTDREDYPRSLSQSLGSQTPPMLWIQGNRDLVKLRMIGFGGSRKASGKGMEIASTCAAELARSGFVVVSGYAGGIDMAAHRSALMAGGSTIIVLPEGMNGFRIKKELRDVWDWNRILVLSEFLPEESWSVSRAMKRNGTIIGLSEAMLIIEAGETGGSLDAGLKALKAGKKLLVPVFSDPAVSALGNNKLLECGAIPLKRSVRTMKPNLSVLNF